ncbi:MAG: hypothetical protein HS111_19560 [Kofleriaceae bacterium]|nr:hypothetical protein [Kofleriaceae bacterium]
MIDLGPWFAGGVGLGAVTGLPLGVVNVAIVEAASRRGARAAAGIGVGGAGADLSHAALAFGGVGQVVIGHPEVSAILRVAAGDPVRLRFRAVAAARGRRRRGPRPTGADRRRARWLGWLALTLPQPGGARGPGWRWPRPAPHRRCDRRAGGGARRRDRPAAAWFVALAHLAARGAAGSARSPRRARGADAPVAIVLAALRLAAFARAAL